MTRRASNICQGRKPWSAPRTERELESSAGGPEETKVPALEHAHGGEEADAGAQGGAADLQFAGELALGREAIAGAKRSAGNKAAHVVDDL
jgi:hypothetical protein